MDSSSTRVVFIVSLLLVATTNAVINSGTNDDKPVTRRDASLGVPSVSYGAPPPSFGGIQQNYGPPLPYNPPELKPPSVSYGPPSEMYGPPKSSFGPPPSSNFHPPIPDYRPPPQESYGPPIKPEYGAPQPPRPLHILPAAPPSSSYGVPSVLYAKGPPGIPSPPTPPHVTYHGWQPIPGLSIPYYQKNSVHAQSSAGTAYSPPKTEYGPPKIEYGPPKPEYGPPKPEYAPPSTGSSCCNTNNINSIDNSYDGSPPPVPVSHNGQKFPNLDYGPPNDGNSYGSTSAQSLSNLYKPPPTIPDINYGQQSAPKQPKKSDSYNLPQPEYGSPSKPEYVPPPKPEYSPPPKSEYGPPPNSEYGPPNSKDSYAPPPSGSYGLPSSGAYRPPAKNTFRPPPSGSYRPPLTGSYETPPTGSYGPPLTGSYGPPPTGSYGPPKESYGLPKETYGPPKESYGGSPKDSYSPPIDSYGSHKESYGPPKQSYKPLKETYGPPKESYGVPKESYGPPKEFYAQSNKPSYQPPLKTSYPPPPSGSYGPPPSESYGLPSKQVHRPPLKDSYGPPISSSYGSPQSGSYGTSSNTAYRPPPPPKDSYGVPPSGYGAPSKNTYTQSPPKNIYGIPVLGFIDNSLKTHYTPSPSSTYNGLPPEGTFGIPLATCCGTPPPDLVSQKPADSQYGLPYGQASGKQITGPNIQPKNPVINRPPVPPGLVESTQYNNFQGEPYIPPPVPEVPTAGSDAYTVPSSSSDYSSSSSNPTLGQNQIVVQDSPQYNIQPISDTSNNVYNQGSSTTNHIPPPESYQHSTQTVSVNNGPQEPIYGTQNQPSLSVDNFGAPQQAFDLNQQIDQSNINQQTRNADSNNYQQISNNNYQPQHEGVDVNEIVKSLGLEGSSVVGSKSVDLNGLQEYPVQGSTGSYMLQFQPGQTGGGNIAHDQVISNGLLQDILSAIENQQKSETSYDNQPQGSEVQQVSTAAVNSSVERTNNAVNKKTEMALFYSTKDGKETSSQGAENLPSEINQLSVNEVSNGNFVSYKSPKVNYVYGDSTPQVVSQTYPQQSTPKTDESSTNSLTSSGK